MTGRLGIDDVRPQISGRTLPAKAVVGEVVPISALVWREGHDAVAATAEITPPQEERFSIHMQQETYRPDNVHAVFVPDTEGLWRFRIDAWSDPMATWRNAVTKKLNAGQSADELANDLHHGVELFERAAEQAPKADREVLLGVARTINDDTLPIDQRVNAGLTDEVREILDEYPLRELVTRGPICEIAVERREALVNSWYELFPRSTGGWDADGNPVHGTFETTAAALDRVAKMGFDTVYFPPIHPIGEINRKGKNNTLTAVDGDVGSPWAIGSKAGGHDAVHPELGTEKDFVRLVKRAEELGLEIALDLALQAAPDHPWARDHREFFTELADGTIAYAENPPKKYQDIYPINFDNDPKGIYNEVYRVVMHWVNLGVTTFRVDNPHTKPVNFWQWLIDRVHETNPEVIFLAEAFTRPARMFGLAKIGFSQSYTYFTWKTSKEDLTDFALMVSGLADVSRPNLFVNTPDILHESLQKGGRAMFAIRAALAATMSPLWGVYSGYELYEHVPVHEGSEEYLDSEKYELRPRDFQTALDNGDSLEPYITQLNHIRRENPALQQLRNIHFHDIENPNLIAYSKVDAVTGNAVLVVVNLDSYGGQEGMINVDMEAIGLRHGDTFKVHDAVSGAEYIWGDRNFVRLEPLKDVAHIFILPDVLPERREKLAWREIPEHDYRP
ncbi:maltotransferase domain-containing protein [Corynebacterium cystitidis]|uniref:Alpha-1,4-glucan:maltose-1-phosphate maltosyltransferase n=1 Tax=Corynebacterium cystitidis DSM 20524 TaxID=1121357 RepID=A0A1H9S3R1_9CORY|nr:maltotransferase domain-containing protein [Corynebacterium cystitidis]WJY82189.1 Alpha-1,4-glucan:maltose-1-phosphate maltosyltransferase [Corynebacterium cystitidis DSM 20524]SER79275.1 alpha-1,4-glucan:maltose-1-phosphate maltosyltransferase [Corynebacterium cystitidis DSM 20524]SNV78035.1 alpha-amylase [Corynebacterium cystitidis]